MYKLLEIKDKQIKLDPDIYEIAKGYNWRFSKNIICTKKNNKYIPLKQLLGAKKDEFLYHKNGDAFDYRKENLECLSRAEYARKIIKHEKSSDFNNICYDKSCNMWGVYVIKEKKQYFGGRYYNAIDAAIAADYLNYSLFKNMERVNLKYENIEDMFQKYRLIIDKYGENTSQRISLSHQGKVQKKKKEKTSKYVGVAKLKRQNTTKCWYAEIRKDRKRYFLGYYLTEEEAARVYDKKALELYGDNATTNFPKGNYKI